MLGEDAPPASGPRRWPASPPRRAEHPAPGGMLLLTAVVLATVALWVVGWLPLPVMVATVAVQVLTRWRARGRVLKAERAVAGHGPDLEMLAAVLDRFEREPVTSPLLAGVHTELVTGGRRPSQVVRRLRASWICSTPGATSSSPPWPCSRCGRSTARWRSSRGVRGTAAPSTPGCAAVGQLEALCSLAGYAWEHPADVYPEIDRPGRAASRRGRSATRSSRGRCVRNDVRARRPGRACCWWSAARTCRARARCCARSGINAVLALAGAPVRARRAAARRPWPSARRCASRTRCRRARRASTPRSRGCGSSSTSRAGRCRCCFCSTRSCTGPTRTTGGSAPRRWCAAWWSAAPSAW